MTAKDPADLFKNQSPQYQAAQQRKLAEAQKEWFLADREVFLLKGKLEAAERALKNRATDLSIAAHIVYGDDLPKLK